MRALTNEGSYQLRGLTNERVLTNEDSSQGSYKQRSLTTEGSYKQRALTNEGSYN